MNSKQIVSLLISSIFLISQSVMAVPEEIASYETMATQVVSGDGTIAPYDITGESLVAMIQGMVGFDVPGSSISFHRKSGQVFVKNTPTNQLIIEEILDKLRAAHKRQIVIEARIVSVKTDDFTGIGIQSHNLNFSGDPNAGETSALVIGSGQTTANLITKTTATGITPNPTQAIFDDLNTILSSTSEGAGIQLGYSEAGNVDFDTILDALGKVSDTNTLANPRISAFNNQRVNISILNHDFFVGEINSDLSSLSGQTAVTQDPVIANAKSGTILDVTPTINANGSITLELHPSFVKTDLTATQSINILTDIDDFVTLPVYTFQEIRTTVTVENGGVVVLGGLITEEETNQRDGIPLLGDIPLVGKLFQSKRTRDVKTHLLIFVKATVKDYSDL